MKRHICTLVLGTLTFSLAGCAASDESPSASGGSGKATQSMLPGGTIPPGLTVPANYVPPPVPQHPVPFADSRVFKARLNNGSGPLKGFVDLHAHLMAHLAFGGKLLAGAPDEGALMPAGTMCPGIGSPPPEIRDGVSTTDAALCFLSGGLTCTIQTGDVAIRAAAAPKCAEACNREPKAAGSAAAALGTCRPVHGGWDAFTNPCGDLIREKVVSSIESELGANNAHSDNPNPDGYPTFAQWPRYNDVLHQQMWIDWIRRAKDGGQRVLVALAVNSATMATAVRSPADDRQSADLQLDEIKRFVERHADFMEVAYSAADLRRIVGADKLAVIMGVELDDLGNFISDRTATSASVRAEIRRLYHDKGVRYVLPMHLIDNKFGGTAVYTDMFAVANWYQTGDWWNLKCAQPSDRVDHRVTDPLSGPIATGLNDFGSLPFPGDLTGLLPIDPITGVARSLLTEATKMSLQVFTQNMPQCPPGMGHMNSKGLTDLGRTAIKEMMSLGMLIDVDHMSQATLSDTLAYAPNYPFMSGHTGGIRRDGGENNHQEADLIEISRRGGVVGIGVGGGDASNWRDHAGDMMQLGIGAIAVGTDVNGMSPLAAPRAFCQSRPSQCADYPNIPYADALGVRWNYNTQGMAHYGLLPDMLRDVEGLPNGRAVVDSLFGGAERVALAWEKASKENRRVLFRNTNGSISLWNVDSNGNQTSYKEHGPLPGWSVVDYSDNRLLWTNTNGSISLWNVDSNGNQTSYRQYGPLPGWSVVNYSHNRVLWKHDSGAISYWHVDSEGNLTSYKEYGPFPGWSVVNGSDTGILWKHDNGSISIWNVDSDGNQTSYKEYGPFDGWSVVNYSDGRILWQNADGRASLWNLDSSANRTSYREHGPFQGWWVVNYSDGRMLWRNGNGLISLWNVDSNGDQTSYNQSGPFAGWSPVDVAQ